MHAGFKKKNALGYRSKSAPLGPGKRAPSIRSRPANHKYMQHQDSPVAREGEAGNTSEALKNQLVDGENVLATLHRHGRGI